MDLALIERLMAMLDQSGLESLEVTEGNLHVKLVKAGARQEPPADRPVENLRAEEENGLVAVTAGLSGTFYRAPAPGAEPFVVEGQRVEEGDRLGLIEAMKMLNPVEAECAGTVSVIHLADASPVEPGDRLFSLDRQT